MIMLTYIWVAVAGQPRKSYGNNYLLAFIYILNSLVRWGFGLNKHSKCLYTYCSVQYIDMHMTMWFIQTQAKNTLTKSRCLCLLIYQPSHRRSGLKTFTQEQHGKATDISCLRLILKVLPAQWTQKQLTTSRKHSNRQLPLSS